MTDEELTRLVRENYWSANPGMTIQKIREAVTPIGHWERTENVWSRCSNCGGISMEETRWCPNCGARMRDDYTL